MRGGRCSAANCKGKREKDYQKNISKRLVYYNILNIQTGHLEAYK